MQKITPFLWFDREAEEAAKFYTSAFKNSKLGKIAYYGKEGYEVHKMTAGTVMTAEFTIEGMKFAALNGGPIFKFNPSLSFHVAAKSVDEVDKLWKILSEGGSVLMELGSYPFSRRYGWLQDRYGLSWQIFYVGEREIIQKITPVLMFVGKVSGKAEEAVTFYTTVFHRAKVASIQRYGKGELPDEEGTVKYASLVLENMQFGAMDSAHGHKFSFNEAVSFLVECENQKEVDYFWDKLSASPEDEQCGWLKDKYGLSWQIVPKQLDEFMGDPDPVKAGRVMEVMLKMKKISIGELEKAYRAG
ncbi:MAG: 3-demethylubiquinone-9 3-methyltransferase [Candidatus Gottesmanbacteria bacterium GW2011_GWA2_43_14]|uniref:3-demethylubiquinone-9 3-methyltransferase n=1 Tax=Candidatus Gottesmanbacteria bacterium GW2011_GWA2_43_14 TaxID=1618443 RepID=A0A0G1GBX5_9BACT|nr:MAG: 3-demethylubiquinone-9 3-methyltransferase [Candidatus Gottesmanbacteria bacterium GW2011_GWA2_43_14]